MTASMKVRLAAMANQPWLRGHVCAIPGCGRPTLRATGKGLAWHHCGYHVQRKARHGSYWHPTYAAAELKPYCVAARAYLRDHIDTPAVAAAIMAVDYLLAFAPGVVSAMEVRQMPAAQKARAAFARLREACIPAQRLLAIFLGVSALIEDDLGSERTSEFRNVQAAKAIHRLASGTHKRWEMWNPVGNPVEVKLNAYPQSSGRVLREIGSVLEEAAADLPSVALLEIIARKVERFGPHASHLGQAQN